MKVRKAVIPPPVWGPGCSPPPRPSHKEMLPMVDKPVIQYIIEEAVASGIEDILIVTNRAKSAMDDYFDYYPELETRLNQAGKDRGSARSAAPRTSPTSSMSVRRRPRAWATPSPGPAASWGRALRRAPGRRYHACPAARHGPAHRRRREVRRVLRGGAEGLHRGHQQVLLCEDLPLEERIFAVSDMNEKPTPSEMFSNYAILGRYVLTPDIFDILERQAPGYGGEIQLTDGLQTLCKQSKMVAVDFEGRRYDTGNLKGLPGGHHRLRPGPPRDRAWLKSYIKDKAELL